MKAATLAAALLVAVATPAAANTVPNWFWSWAHWKNSHHGTRPSAAPARVPHWAWRLLATHRPDDRSSRTAAPAPKAPATTPAPAPPPTTTTAPAPAPAPAPASASAPAPAPAPSPAPATTTTRTTTTTTTTTTTAPPPAPAPTPTTTTTTTTTPPPPPPPPPTSGLSSLEQSLADAANAARQSAGLRPLAIDANLETAARAHTQNLIANAVFTHDFIKNGVAYPFSTWITWYYAGFCAGENLAGAANPATAVQLWLGSPPHRANLLSTMFTTMGVGSGNGLDDIVFGGC